MQPTFAIKSKVIRFSILISLISHGCAPGAVAQPTESPLPEEPTQVEPAVVEQPTVPAATAETQFQAGLTASKSSVRVFKDVVEVPQDQTVNVNVGDRIEAVGDSRSILNIPNVLEVTIQRNAIVYLGDVKQESGTSTDVTLNLIQGHIFVNQSDASISHVTVQTLYSTVNTLEEGTEFDICHNERLTCVWVEKGSVEVIAQSQKRVVNAGEASYVLKDQPPSQAICAPVEDFVVWEENYQASADTPALGAVVSQLPQKSCAEIALELPPNANNLYGDDFTDPSSRWFHGRVDNYLLGYSPEYYYEVQIQKPNDKYAVYVPNKTSYADIGVDLVAFTGLAAEGDYRYGLVFRGSGDQYYAFVVSPRTKTWYMLKSVSDSSELEVLEEGTEESIQGLEAKDGLRVISQGSEFSLFINGKPVGQVTDSDYVRGEVGLFVQTLDSLNALIYFDQITIWNTRSPGPGLPAKERICTNQKDDDGDGLVDKADPDCKRPDQSPPPTTYP
jgi:hypothetical protein